MKYLLALSAEKLTAPVPGPFEGVGLLRGEYVCRVSEEYVTTSEWRRLAAEYVSHIATLYEGQPVWYRVTDLETSEVNVLRGVDHVIDGESNPALGLRGMRRARAYPETFRAEIEVIVKLSKSFPNLNILLPNVGDETDIRFAAEELGRLGYSNRLGTMVETPSAVMRLRQCIEQGASYALIGMNDLTSLTLGMNRGAGGISFSHPAMLETVGRVVETASAAGIPCGVAGYYDRAFLEAADRLGVDFGVLHLSFLDKYLGPEFAAIAKSSELWAIKQKTRDAIAARAQRRA